MPARESGTHAGTSGSHEVRTWYRYAADAMNRQRLNHDRRFCRAFAVGRMVMVAKRLDALGMDMNNNSVRYAY